MTAISPDGCGPERSMLALATPAQAQPADTAAYFEFTGITREKAVLKLTDPAKIQHARDLISGATIDEPHVIVGLGGS
ncbi:BP74-related protein [Streptosporangium roseum]|uniref:BP74-related protein n=1 Tax=Streptosporangium roseum TaxID=2001 RepID=UPI0033179F1F